MARTWKNVSVFISSTFNDMHAERDHLIKVMFPKLRARLEKHRIHLVDIDLRWGVTREQAEDDRVLGFCLQQIDECRPFFIGILGERYGWVPEKLPALNESQYGWIQAATGKSITDLEIMHGVLRNPTMTGHASFYFRDSEFMTSLSGQQMQIFSELPDQNEIARLGQDEVLMKAEGRKQKLENLKAEINVYCQTTNSPLHNYPCQWDTAKPSPEDQTTGRLIELDQFGTLIENDLWKAISKEYSHILEPEPEHAREGTAAWLAEEEDYHERFIESRLRVYVGRQGIHNTLTKYLDSDSTQPLLLVGGSGTGKSAIMGKLWQDWQNNHPDKFILPHDG